LRDARGSTAVCDEPTATCLCTAEAVIHGVFPVECSRVQMVVVLGDVVSPAEGWPVCGTAQKPNGSRLEEPAGSSPAARLKTWQEANRRRRQPTEVGSEDEKKKG
jgi:hypothetical protein